MRVVKVGAGPIGLAGARHLKCQGCDVSILEQFADLAGTVPAVGIPRGVLSGRFAAARVDEVAA